MQNGKKLLVINSNCSLFLYFLALTVSSFNLDMTVSYHNLAIASFTSMKTMEEVVDYFRFLTFVIAPPMFLFYDVEEPCALSLPARRYSSGSVVP